MRYLLLIRLFLLYPYEALTGLISFANVPLDTLGTYLYSVKEISGPTGSQWDLDTTAHPVELHTTPDGQGSIRVDVDYPDGAAPSFVNTLQNSTCGLIEFPELIFDTPGDYEYTLRELTPSGSGWDTDTTEYRVIIHVTDDGFGNYVASAEYPNGYPEFVDVFTGAAARYIISACKTSIGAGLPAGRFQFGIYDDTDTLVATTTNGAADETVTPIGPVLIDLSRKHQLQCAGTVFGNVAVAAAPRQVTQRPATQRSNAATCEGCEQAILRRLEDLRGTGCSNGGA